MNGIGETPALPPFRTLMSIMAVALMVRLLHVWFFSESPLFWAPTSDAFEHYDLATRLAAGDWLGRGIGPYHRPQLFAHTQAVIYTLFGPKFVLTHVFLTIVDVFSVGVWYLVARWCFRPGAALLGGLFMALHWPFVYFSASGYMETFALLLNGCLLLALLRHAALTRMGVGNALSRLLVAGIIAGLGILTRPTMLVVMPFIGLWVLAIGVRGRHGTRRWSNGLLHAVVLTIATTITISPNAIRHWTMFDLWAPLGTGSELNLHMGNSFDGWGWDVSSPGIEYAVYQKLPFVMGSPDPTIDSVRAFWRERNSAIIADDPGSFLLGLGRKALMLLNAYEIHCTQDFIHAREVSPILRLLPGLPFFLPLAIAGMLMLAVRLAAARRRDMRWFAVLLLFLWIVPYLAGTALYLAISRHRLPFVPPMLLIAGWTVWTLWTIWTRYTPGQRTTRVRIGWGMALAAGLVIANLPVVPKEYYSRHERWWTQVNLGVATMKLGRLEEARAHFTTASTIMTEKLEHWNQLAAVASRLGEHDEAARNQQILLGYIQGRYPDYYMIEAQVLEQLVRYQLQANRRDDAIATARQLVALVPDSPQAQQVLQDAMGEE